MRTFSLHLLTLLLTPALQAAPAPIKPVAAEAPEVYRVISSFPKYVTADIEFRDSSGTKWPNFFYGKPANDAGYISLAAPKPSASFELLCDKMAQANGDQSRRVLGELCPPGQSPPVKLTITGMGTLQASANAKEKNALAAELYGVLQVGNVKTPVKIAASFRRHEGKGDEKKSALMVEGKFSLKAGDLGLKALASGTVIEGRFGLTAYPPQVDGKVEK